MLSAFRGRDFVVSDDGPAARTRESLAVHGAEVPWLSTFQGDVLNPRTPCRVVQPIREERIDVLGERSMVVSFWA
jgi:hypothetical protein